MRIFGKLLKWFGYFFLCVFLILAGVYVYLAMQTGKPAEIRAIFRDIEKPRPLVIAHRGGAGLFPENTLYAFRKSWEMGVDVLELDVRETADGALVVMHDRDVRRTTDGEGEISRMTLAEVKRLDAGYRFTTDGGESFPFRGRKIEVPTLEEIFVALPDAEYVIEPKQESETLVRSLCELLGKYKMTEKVIVGSFSQSNLDNFRRECPEVATSASPSEASRFLALYKTGLAASYTPPMSALQTPERVAGFQVVTMDFVETARRLNLQVQVWTINETEDMSRLIESGVDGIMTDYPDRLLKLVGRMPKSAE
jgi:Glycerophosphoryl diester phosphodiesterase